MLRTVRADRYLQPFKEGGSVPALVEGSDLGLYVVKLRGAAQGERALVAELVAGELARTLGLAVPELVFVDVDRAIADSEPDPEIALPLEKSVGLNVGLDFLPGSITFDPIVGPAPDPGFASLTVLFDAFVVNVDRTPRNPNLLRWHKKPWLIDHGAALYFHHGWSPESLLEGSDDPFTESQSHVLLRSATELDAAAEVLADKLDEAAITRVLALVPEEWLDPRVGFADVAEHRDAYRKWLVARRENLSKLVDEAKRARGGAT